MFEELLPQPDRNGRPRRDRAVGVLVTVAVHALLGLLIYHARFTVKLLPFGKQEVRSVVIVPPLSVNIPRIVGGRDLATLPGGEAGSPGPRIAPAEPPAGGGRETEAGPEEGPGPGPAGGVPPPGAGSAVPSLSSKFRESLVVRGRSGLTIPLAPPGTPPGPPGIYGGAPVPDFSKYDRGAYAGGVGGYGPGRGRGGGTAGGGTGGRQRVGMSIPLKNYDLMPWASVVIDRLQVNWVLPAVAEIPNPARIGMIVIIRKTGELDSIEILEGTTVEALDRAALDAIRAALPFPALPEDFPGDLLEIIFEFVYND